MAKERAAADPGRVLGLAVLVLGAAFHLLFLVSLRTHWLDPLFFEAGGVHGQASDYFGIYQASDNLTQGRSIYLQEGRPPDSSHRVPYFYFYRYLPPTTYAMAISALLLEPWPSYWLWVMVTEALLGLMLFSLTRMRSPPGPVRSALAGIALGFSPFYLEQWMGQFSFLMAVFIWGTFWPEVRASGAAGRPAGGKAQPVPQEQAEGRFRGLLRRRDIWSWSASVGLKIFPALYALPLLRQRYWRRVALAATLVILACLPYFLAHPQDLEQFITANFRRLSAGIMGGSYGLANLIRALCWHLPPQWTGRLLVLGPLHVYSGNAPLYMCSVLITLLSLLITWRMTRYALAETMALWTLTFFLVQKEVWEYHYVMLLPVVWLLAARGGWRWPLFWGFLLALPTPYVFYSGLVHGLPVEQWPLGIVLLHFGSKVFPTVGLYVLTARRCLGNRRPILDHVG